MRLSKFLLLAITPALLVSCSHVSKTDIRNETRFSLDEYPIIQNEVLSSYLRNISSKVCGLYRQRCPNVTIADTDHVQATASYDDHTIYISRGMLYAIKNEGELLALIGHEIGHFQLHGLTAEKQNTREADTLNKLNEIAEDLSGVETPSMLKEKLEKLRAAQFNQKNEQEADEFGTQTAIKLKYNSYALADLLKRLSSFDNKNVLEKIKAIEGSHKTLAERAEHLRKYLQSKEVKQVGLKNEEAYLKVVRQLYPRNIVSKKDPNDEAVLEQLFEKIKQRNQINTALSVDEFLDYMTRLREVSSRLGVLPEFESYISDARANSQIAEDESPEFMMELIRLTTPLWARDANAQKILDILSMFAKMGIGTIPVVGDAIDFYEFFVGRDFYTDQPLTLTERSSSAFSVIAGNRELWRNSSNGLGQISRMTEESDVQKKYRLINNDENRKVLEKLASDIAIKKVPKRTEEAHIPLEEYIFVKFWE